MWDKQSIIEENKKNIVKFPCTADSPLVSIVLVNHNGEGHLRRLFSSLKTADFYQKYELIVVEQVSTDGSMKVIDEYKNVLPLVMFENQSNESFAIASNKGAGIAKGEYLLFLNNDIEVTDGWLDALLETSTEDNAGAIGARLIYPEMPAGSVNAGKSWSVQHKGVLWRQQVLGERVGYFPYHWGNGSNPFIVDSTPIQYGVVTAACLLVKNIIFWEVGGFDENYIWGYEDVDLCLKIYRHGYNNYYCPAALLFHYEFGTQSKDSTSAVNERRIRNRYYLYERWNSWLEKYVLKDKLNNTSFFSESRLRVCLIVDTDKDSYNIVKRLNDELNANGYISTIIDINQKNIYQVEKDVDIIISLEPSYDPMLIKDASPYLLTFAWCINKLIDWCNGYLQYYNYVMAWDSCACDLIYERIGRLVHKFTGDCMKLMDILRSRLQQDDNKVLILSPAPDEKRGESWGDHHFAKDLARGFQKHGYSTEVRAFDTWDMPFSGKYVISIRGSILPKPFHPKMEYVNIIWNISHPEVLSPRYYDEYDKIFVASRVYTEELKDKIKMPLEVLLQCTDLEKFYKVKSAKRHEILFIGDALGRFRQIVKDLIPTKYEFSIYGRNWEQYISKKYIKGQYVANEELKYFYGGCDILLNDHWPEMRKKGFLSNRLFDGLASGAFVITDDVKGLELDLSEGVIAYNGTRDDLREKLDYWMKHPEKRLSSAEKGRRIVEEKHTFYHRAAKMIDYMKKVSIR